MNKNYMGPMGPGFPWALGPIGAHGGGPTPRPRGMLGNIPQLQLAFMSEVVFLKNHSKS